MHRWATNGLLLAGLACGSAEELSPHFRFERQYVDLEYGGNGRPGWVRAGDMDGDGDVDLVAGGGEALYVYENAGDARRWVRHGSLDATERIGANGAVLFDVDGDGDLDVVSAQYRATLGWWENPGGPLRTVAWPYHVLDAGSDFFAHDVILADVDGDGREEEFVFALYRKPEVRVEWFRAGSDPSEMWARSIVEAGRDELDLHYAGLDVGDLDRDGDPDIAFSNGWYEANPGDPRWSWHEVTRIRGISNALLRDVDADGGLDLILSAGHHGRGVFWFEAPEDARGAWRRHDIAPDILHPECLQAADLDADGDLDLLTCDLDFERWDEQVHRVYVLENLGSGTGWRRHLPAPTGFPSHLLQLVDVNQDGRPDLVSEATGHSVVSYYENATPSATAPALGPAQ